MTDLTLVRGDSRNYQLFVTEADTITPVDLTLAILRFAVKKRFDEQNSAALIFKTSYDATEILISDPVNGEAIVFVLSGDTPHDRPSDYSWDIDITRPGNSLTAAGTLGLTAGSPIIIGTGLDLTRVLQGDVIVPAGVPAANQIPLVVTAVGGDGSKLDPGAGNLVTDYSGWTTEAAVSHEIFRGDRKTPDDLSGTFTLLKDVAT